MIAAMIIIFILGYTAIAFEHKTGINKTAVALILCTTLWTMLIFSPNTLILGADPSSFHNFIAQNPAYNSIPITEQIKKYITDLQMVNHIGNISEIIFYLLGAMTIVEVIDLHHGFSGITNNIRTKSKKKLLWLIACITFFMSAILDNMTTAIVMIMMLRKLLGDQKDRWIFGSIVIIAANAGGAWTPIGDVTTIMLWINSNITSGSIIKSLFLPSLISLAIPTGLISSSLKGKFTNKPEYSSDILSHPVNKREQKIIFITGILCLLAVPVFKSVTGLPPFAGILLTLGILWIYMDLLYNQKPLTPPEQQFRLPYVLSKIDFPTILFFFGILMSVATLEVIGVLHELSGFLNSKIHNIYIISTIIGFLSSVIDNVPLVAATMDMYPVTSVHSVTGMPEAGYMLNFIQDGAFWNLIAYTTGTGGSILIIGSAAGVVIMGLEKINFMWYMKHISWIAILGFLGGIGIYYLQNILL